MPIHIDPSDPRYVESAAQILRRHGNAEPEANITSAVRDFLIVTKLAKSEEIDLESPPADNSRKGVDLTALDTFIEMKRRIGNGINPNPQWIEQLDGYLAESQGRGKGVRMGILTDGKYWLLRWNGAGPVKTVRPYAFTLETPDRWLLLYEWLRGHALVSLDAIRPDRAAVESHFGPNNPHYQRDIDTLAAMYREYSGHETIKVKRRLWGDLLRTALGEIARSPEQMDDLFIRHTYLTAVIGMVVQASFGIDINGLADTDPADLVQGRDFRSKTGLQGVVESDFFAWPAEVGGLPLLKTIARRAARFDWQSAPNDIAAILYETIIPPQERRTLGEYYTPSWLARSMVREMVTDPSHSVLDPACGSGAFIAETVAHLLETHNKADRDPKETLEWLRISVTGIDIHPVAVHLARSAWVLAAQPAIKAAVDHGFSDPITVPIYLGDALQLRFQSGDMFAEQEVTIQVEDEENTTLVFPVSLVKRAEDFDGLMSDVAEAIEHGDDPYFALDDHGVTLPPERRVMQETIEAMKRLHAAGRDHIWAYYTRNLVRPVVLARKKVDVIVGNPPWLNYNRTSSILRSELEGQSKNRYGIWQGGRYATHQDVAGLFFARSVDLYLRDGGVIGMVMPHSALQTGQYAKWRTGNWQARPVHEVTGVTDSDLTRLRDGSWQPRYSGSDLAADFTLKPAWDLEQLEPNTFFPVPASVVFARRLPAGAAAKPLAGNVERWRGKAGSDDVERELAPITDTSIGTVSLYDGYSRLGAILYPRCLLFVEETENAAIIQAGQTVTVNPRRGSQDKEPWRSLDLTAITDRTIEKAHVFNVHLGETIVPYATLDPLQAVLPLKQGDTGLPTDSGGVGGVRLGDLDRRMRERWQTVSALWETHKQPVNKLNLLGQLDYWGHLSAQVEWQQNPGDRPFRVVYTKSGQPTAVLLHDDTALLDHKLFWISCKGIGEANYLLAIINSQTLYESVIPLMPKGQFGARDVQKHLWKLPIPEFSPRNKLHAAIAKAGQAAAEGVALQLARLRQDRGSDLTVTIARRELRKWLRASPEGAAVEEVVGQLLRGAG